MNIKPLITMSIMTWGLATSAQAQKAEDAASYIARYKNIAIAEQARTGVPAAIKLAQGIHESGCGASELSTNANNHFGIKCKSTWVGKTYAYTDDAKDECFRSYEDDKSSYIDHSDFLRNNPRYAALFQLDTKDYKAWAQGLKKSGYATNPKYAQRIVDLVERYDLNQYTLVALNSNLDSDATKTLNDEPVYASAKVAPPVVKEQTYFGLEPISQEVVAHDKPVIYYVKTQKNGLKGFYAKQGDMLLNAAYAHNIRYGKLLELNDLNDEPLAADVFIYLEKKRKSGSAVQHVMKENELLMEVAQAYAIRMKDLRQLNLLANHEEPQAGTVLQLKTKASKKPLLQGPIFGDKPNPEYVKTEGSKDVFVRGGFTKATPPKEETPVTRVVSAPEPKVEAPKEQEENFNIANEPAVEVQIAQERAALEETAVPEPEVKEETAPAVQPVEEMSDLDRLKAKLDRSVYGTTTPKAKEPVAPKVKENTKAVPAQETIYETRPAAQTAGNEGISDLKKRIAAHQQSNVTSPVVAQRYVEETVTASRNATPKSNSGYHIVKKGETAFSIAKQYGLSLNELISLNKLPSNGSVQLGAKLKVK